MSLFDKIKDIDLVEYATKLYGEPKRLNGNFWYKYQNEKTPSLVVYSNWRDRGYFNYGTGNGGTIIDMCMNYFNIEMKDAIRKLKEEYKIEDDGVFVKPVTIKREEILGKFEELRMKGTNNNFNLFLQKRGVSFEFIQENLSLIDEVSKEFGVAEGVRVGKENEKSIFKNCIVFPCYQYNNGIVENVGVKLRRVDNEKIGNLKSASIKGQKTGLIYTKDVFDFDSVLLCEGETDYMILKILGFKNVIGNLGGVSSNIDQIKKITKNTKVLISFYDNDNAGIKANYELKNQLNRDIRAVQYPLIDEGKTKDVNDLFKMGYTKHDFEKMIENAFILEGKYEDLEIEEEEKENIIEKKDGYYVTQQTKDGGLIEVKITNFKIKIEDIVLYKNEGHDEEKKLILKVYNTRKETRGEFSARNTTDVKSFNAKIRSLETSFSCYDMRASSLESLLRYIHKNIDIKNTIVVKHQGYIPEFNIFTFENGILFNQKFMEYNENKVVDIGDVKIKFNGEGHYIPKYQDEFYYDENIKNTIIDDLRYMFNGAGGDLFLGFLMASLFVNSAKELKPFPVLFVVGKKGSGKTTAVDYGLRILGLEVSAENFETSTDFVDQLDISNISSLPMWRDEYKNVMRVKKKDGYIKSVFDRNGLSKGTIKGNELGKNTYPVNATLILSGEENPNDDAVYSRCAIIQVKQKREGGAEKFEAIKKRIDFYGSIMRELLTKNNFYELLEQYKNIFNETKKYLIQDLGLEKRILNVYLPIISGFLFFEKVLLGKEMDEKAKEIWFSDIFSLIQDKMEEENNNDIINEFFGVIDTLYALNDIQFSQEFVKEKNGIVQIAYNSLYSIFNGYQRKQGGREIPSRDLKKYLISEFGAKESTMNIFGGKVVRSLQLSGEIPQNLKNILENLEIYKKDLTY